MIRYLGIFCFVLLSSCYRLPSYGVNPHQPSPIEKLHDSVLLIELEWPESSISALEYYGKEKRASKVEQKFIARNIKIAGAFKEFEFCQVYFFFSDRRNSEIITDPTDFILFDTELQEIKVDLTTYTNYFIGQFDYRWIQSANEGRDEYCLLICDESYRELNDLFPGRLVISRIGSANYYKGKIKYLQNQLYRSYHKTQRKRNSQR